MNVAPILTRHTVLMLREHIARSVYDQLLGWVESTLSLCQQFASLRSSEMGSAFADYSRRYMPHRITLIQMLPLLLGQEEFGSRYLKSVGEMRDEIFLRADKRSLPLATIRQTYDQYDGLFRQALLLSSHEIEPSTFSVDVSRFLENIWVKTTEFDFAFTTFNLALLDEIECSHEDRYIFLLDKSSERLAESREQFATLESLLHPSGGKDRLEYADELFRLAGRLSNREAQEIVTAIEDNCERIDAQW